MNIVKHLEEIRDILMGVNATEDPNYEYMINALDKAISEYKAAQQVRDILSAEVPDENLRERLTEVLEENQ